MNSKRTNYDDDWERFREKAQDAKKQRLQGDKNPIKKQKYLYVTRVDYNAKKRCYLTLAVRDAIPFDDEINLPVLKNVIWEFYESKLDILHATHDVDIVLGLKGPVANENGLVMNKSIFYVHFKEISTNDVETDISSSSSSVKSVQQTVIPKSKLPTMAIFGAGKKVDLSLKGEILEVKRFFYDDIDGQWKWGMPFNVTLEILDVIGQGTFRKCNMVRILKLGELPLKNYVIKVFTADAIENRKQANNICIDNPVTDEKLIEEDLAKKAVQSQTFARYISLQFSQKVGNVFGECPIYIPIYFAKSSRGQVYTIEHYIEGDFLKYMNNTMDKILISSEPAKKSVALAHFSYEYKNGLFLITDLQGVGLNLTDPEIASTNLVEDNEMLFGGGNLSQEALDGFKKSHICNKYCKLANLQPIITEI